MSFFDKLFSACATTACTVACLRGSPQGNAPGPRPPLQSLAFAATPSTATSPFYLPSAISHQKALERYLWHRRDCMLIEFLCRFQCRCQVPPSAGRPNNIMTCPSPSPVPSISLFAKDQAPVAFATTLAPWPDLPPEAQPLICFPTWYTLSALDMATCSLERLPALPRCIPVRLPGKTNAARPRDWGPCYAMLCRDRTCT
jgi:hypothetical protein